MVSVFGSRTGNVNNSMFNILTYLNRHLVCLWQFDCRIQAKQIFTGESVEGKKQASVCEVIL